MGKSIRVRFAYWCHISSLSGSVFQKGRPSARERLVHSYSPFMHVVAGDCFPTQEIRPICLCAVLIG